jgi:hypothetical protein
MRKGSPTISPAMARRQSNLLVDVVESGRVFRSVSTRQFRRSVGAGIVSSLPSDEHSRDDQMRGPRSIISVPRPTARRSNLMAARSNKQTAEEAVQTT